VVKEGEGKDYLICKREYSGTFHETVTLLSLFQKEIGLQTGAILTAKRTHINTHTYTQNKHTHFTHLKICTYACNQR